MKQIRVQERARGFRSDSFCFCGLREVRRPDRMAVRRQRHNAAYVRTTHQSGTYVRCESPKSPHVHGRTSASIPTKPQTRRPRSLGWYLLFVSHLSSTPRKRGGHQTVGRPAGSTGCRPSGDLPKPPNAVTLTGREYHCLFRRVIAAPVTCRRSGRTWSLGTAFCASSRVRSRWLSLSRGGRNVSDACV